MEECEATFNRISEKKKELAIYFCEESEKLKLEELFQQLRDFVRDVNHAREVCNTFSELRYSISKGCLLALGISR